MISERWEVKPRSEEQQLQEVHRSLFMIPVNLAFFGLLAGLFWWLLQREFKKAYS